MVNESMTSYSRRRSILALALVAGRWRDLSAEEGEGEDKDKDKGEFHGFAGPLRLEAYARRASRLRVRP